MPALSTYSQVIHATRYARWDETEQRREYWDETCKRYVDYFAEHLKENFDYTIPKKLEKEVLDALINQDIMPSMRAFMTAGKALKSTEVAAYNCSALTVDSIRSFSEHMYVLMCGTGSGYSVEKRFTDHLPEIPEELHDSDTVVVVADSRKGWCVALNQFISLLYAGNIPKWDVSKIRPEGARLKTFGGYSSGPSVLVELFEYLIKTFKAAKGRKLRPVEVFGIMCMIAQIVIVGGVRRSACICLFDKDDAEMRTAKSGAWWVANPHYAMANISAVFESKPDSLEFMDFWRDLVASKAGEPGMFNRQAVWEHVESFGRSSRNKDGSRIQFLTNPCCVSGDTFIHTANGPKTIKSIAATPTVVMVNGTPALAKNGSWVSGNKALYDLTTDAGYTLRCTDDHRVMTTEGWKLPRDLTVDDKLVINEHDYLWEGNGSFAEGHVLGMFVGDGNWSGTASYFGEVKVWDKDDGAASLRDAVIDEWREIGYAQRSDAKEWRDYNRGFTTLNISKFPEKFGISREDKLDISKVEMTSSDFHRGFLRGLFDADGHVEGSASAGYSARVTSTRFEMLQSVQRMLLRLGIFSTIRKLRDACTSEMPDGKGGYASFECQATYRLIVASRSLQRFYDVVGFYHEAKQQRLRIAIESTKFYSKPFVTNFKSLTPVGTDTVYDIEVETLHAFDANGLVAHNSEILLRPNQFCNLSGICIRPEDTKETLLRKTELATILGTWQSTLSDFDYLRKSWKHNVEEERLLGVCLTGVTDHGIIGATTEESGVWLTEMKECVWETNKKYAKAIGINPSTSVTALKPAGNSGELCNVSSGIHPRYAPYYIRTIRQSNGDPTTEFLKAAGVPWEVSKQNARDVVFSFPVKSPEGAVCAKDRSAIEQLEHWLHVKNNFTTHTVSCTIYVREHEWVEVGAWVYKHFDDVTGLSFLPYDDHTYEQAPYQPITEEEYNVALQNMPDVIDWSLLKHFEAGKDSTNVSQEFACQGGACELK